MSLREQMALDACTILNTDELGERALWTRTGATAGMPRTVRLIEQPERQNVRRANVWTVAKGTTVAKGDTFRVTRGSVTTTWRVLYTDPAETALQRSYCHLQLDDLCTFHSRRWTKTENGSAQAELGTVTGSVRCQWFQSSAEPDTANRRRRMEGEFWLLLQDVPDLDSMKTIVDSEDRKFRVERLEQGFTRLDLPYLVCSRCDV